MSYYDHAVLMHYKLERWNQDEPVVRQRHRNYRREPVASLRGPVVTLLVVVAGLVMLGVTGLMA